MNKYKFEKGFNIRRSLVILAVVFLICYGLFNARNLILGPQIELYTPTQNIETEDKLLTIKGKAENITFLSLNSKPIFVDMEGLFEEKLLLSPGSNIIEIKAKDRFKKEVLKTIKVYYKQSPAPDGAGQSPAPDGAGQSPAPDGAGQGTTTLDN